MDNCQLSIVRCKLKKEVNPVYQKTELVLAHQNCRCNRTQLRKSDMCGCFQCGEIFKPSHLLSEDWTDDGETALCPFCGMDSVIGDAAGFPISDKFLDEMKVHRFSL